VDDLQVLSWLHDNGCPCDYDLMCMVAAAGAFISFLQCVKDNALVVWIPEALSYFLSAAAAYDQLDTAKVRTPH
jgi:hypothetical protein